VAGRTAVHTDAALDEFCRNDTLAGPGARAIVVVDPGRIVGSATSPALAPHSLARLVDDQNRDAGVIACWSGRQLPRSIGILVRNDGRERIRLADLLAMSSGLQWNEAYGRVSMSRACWYLQPDMAAFAQGATPGRPVAKTELFSGTAVI